jgi:hypothetical protein
MPTYKMVVMKQCHCTMRSSRVHIVIGWDGVIGLPLIGGFRYIQLTLTTVGFKKLPLVRQLCLVVSGL